MKWSVLAGLPLLTLIVLTPLAEGFTILPKERSWHHSLTVPAGQSASVRGLLRRDLGGIQVYGNLTVRSCCGFSTNDIRFQIGGVENHRNFGTVIGSLTFEYNTMHDDDWSLYFGNTWNQSSPSYHNKTVEVMVREIVPSSFSFLGIFAILLPAIAALAIGVIVTVTILLRRGRKRYGLPSPP